MIINIFRAVKKIFMNKKLFIYLIMYRLKKNQLKGT